MKLFKGEVGAQIQQTLGWDTLALDGTKTAVVYRPDGTKYSRTGADITIDDSLTGTWSMLTKAGELNQTGEYMCQLKLQNAGATVTRYGQMFSFRVEDVLVSP